jgi:SAM-dependent methyltransferase
MPAPAPSLPAAPAAEPKVAADSVENRYYAYLRSHGYSSTDSLIAVLRVYLPLFAGCPRVADLGCGHGEFLEMLRAEGHAVAGVDVDPAMVAACRAQGFDVALGDAEAWLAARHAAFDGVFSSNVVEHLPAETVARWVAAAHMALRPGGRIVLATPNPESLIVQFHEFWRDPTHVRLYSRQLLEFMLADAGFVQVESHTNPASAWEGGEETATALEAALPLPAPVETPTFETPLPTAPEPQAPLRDRWTWRLVSFVYRKFSEPFLLALRADIERHRLALRDLAEATAREREALEAVRERMARLAAAQRFLHPPREIYVTGIKPGAPASLPQG